MSVINSWMLRPNPNGSKMDEFKSKNILACGWGYIGDLSFHSKEDIKKRLQDPPHECSGIQLRNALATLDIVVNKMKINDLVLLPNGAEIQFCIIKSEYKYDPSADNDEDSYPHQREVEFLNSVERSELPIELRNSLKAHQAATCLSKYTEIIKALAYGDTIDLSKLQDDLNTQSVVSINYPIRPNYSVSITVPADITEKEAERLGDFCKTIHFE